MTNQKTNAQLLHDERPAFEAAYAGEFSNARVQTYTAKDIALLREGDGYGERPYLNGYWKGWQARAALAQPSTRKSHVAEALRTADWSNTCIGNKALIQAAIEHLEAQPSPAPELERPEVVARRYGFSGGVIREDACPQEWKESSEYQPLMLVAQHDRIAGGLLAEIKDADGLSKILGDLLREIDLTIRGPEPALARSGYPDLPQRVKTLVEERNAAQARVAELYRQEHVARVDFSEPWSIAWNDSANPPANGTRLYSAPAAQVGQVPEWIACADRLPAEEESQFLILLEDGSICVSDYLCDLDAGWFFQMGEASHWLPLPYAPTQGGE